MYRVYLWLIPLLAARIVAAGEDEGKQARAQFKQGIKLYEDGDFENAAIAFDRAYELRPSYKILYNVGQVESDLKHYARALTAYSEYLEAGGSEVSEERRREVTTKIEELKLLVAHVTVEYSRDGVTVLIDEERQGTTPLEKPLLVDMGSHELSLREGIKEIYRETIRVAGGQDLTLSLDAEKEELDPAPVPEAETEGPAPADEEVPAPESAAAPTEEKKAEKAETAEEPQKKKKRVWTWVALGVGAVSGILGSVAGGVAMTKENDLEKACPEQRCLESQKKEADSIKRTTIIADALYGVAAVGIVTGIVLFFVEPKKRNEEKSLSVAPAVSPNGSGLVIERRF
jgi:tetratricopeptide (TPR) repeat protein